MIRVMTVPGFPFWLFTDFFALVRVWWSSLALLMRLRNQAYDPAGAFRDRLLPGDLEKLSAVLAEAEGRLAWVIQRSAFRRAGLSDASLVLSLPQPAQSQRALAQRFHADVRRSLPGSWQAALKLARKLARLSRATPGGATSPAADARAPCRRPAPPALPGRCVSPRLHDGAGWRLHAPP